jgi:TPR repeat protein
MARMSNAMNRATFEKDYYALFDSLGKVKDFRKAFPLLMVAAKNGHPHAQNLVGYCYDLGLGPRRNEKTAVHWYAKAAEWLCQSHLQPRGFLCTWNSDSQE